MQLRRGSRPTPPLGVSPQPTPVPMPAQRPIIRNALVQIQLLSILLERCEKILLTRSESPFMVNMRG
jgi:hypothetical protein